MSLTPWKKIRSEVVAENPWWKYRKDTLIAPNGEEHEYHYMSDLGGVMIVAINDEGKIPLVRQYRPIFDRESLEFPAGGIEVGGDPLEAAHRELAEETDWAAKEMKLVGSVAVTPGRADTIEHVFVAKKLYKKPTDADPTEEFEVIWRTPEEIDQMINSQEINDGWAITAWHLAKPHLSR